MAQISYYNQLVTTKAASQADKVAPSITRIKQNEILFKRLEDNLNDKSTEFILAFCKNELEGISTLVEAGGDHSQVICNLQKNYKLIDQNNPATKYLLCDPANDMSEGLISLFMNTEKGCFKNQSINPVGAKYTKTLLNIIQAIEGSVNLDQRTQSNINSLFSECQKFYHSLFPNINNYLQNVKACYLQDQNPKKLKISLGRENGTMGTLHSLEIKIKPENDLQNQDIKSFTSEADFLNYLITSNLSINYPALINCLKKLGYATAHIENAPHSFIRKKENKNGSFALLLEESEKIVPLYCTNKTTLNICNCNDQASIRKYLLEYPENGYPSLQKLKKLLIAQGYSLAFQSIMDNPNDKLVFDNKKQEFRLNKKFNLGTFYNLNPQINYSDDKLKALSYAQTYAAENSLPQEFFFIERIKYHNIHTRMADLIASDYKNVESYRAIFRQEVTRLLQTLPSGEINRNDFSQPLIVIALLKEFKGCQKKDDILAILSDQTKFKTYFEGLIRLLVEDQYKQAQSINLNNDTTFDQFIYPFTVFETTKDLKSQLEQMKPLPPKASKSKLKQMEALEQEYQLKKAEATQQILNLKAKKSSAHFNENTENFMEKLANTYQANYLAKVDWKEQQKALGIDDLDLTSRAKQQELKEKQNKEAVGQQSQPIGLEFEGLKKSGHHNKV